MVDSVTDLSHCKKIMIKKRCRLSLSHVTMKKVMELLCSLSNSRTSAVDELDNFSVKVAAPVIAGPVHLIVTLSIMQQVFPSSWKYAMVLPLHKKLCPLQQSNYRPVAILSPLSKVLERSYMSSSTISSQ